MIALCVLIRCNVVSKGGVERETIEEWRYLEPRLFRVKFYLTGGARPDGAS